MNFPFKSNKMKKTSLFIFLITATVLFLISCRGGNRKEVKEIKEPAVTAPEVSREIANTILTAPEDFVFVIHKVADFNKWKTGYEGHDTVRQKNGLHNYFIGRGLYDTSMVIVALKADDMKKAQAFASGAGLRKLMQEAGVQGAPVFHYVIATWQDTLKMGYLLSLNSFMVKDWDRWRNSFDEGNIERDNNGLMARIVARDYATDKKVVLLTALRDTAKAFQYFTSDALKKRMEAGGVQGTPKRFTFRIFHQY